MVSDMARHYGGDSFHPIERVNGKAISGGLFVLNAGTITPNFATPWEASWTR